MRNPFILPLGLAIALLVACSSQPSQPAQKPQPKPPEFQTGRPIFQQVFVAARGWARDAQPVRLQSQITPGNKDRDGKSTVWSGTFASPSQQAAKTFTWSGTSAPDLPERGITPGPLDSYSPTNTSTEIFDVRYLKVDSDAAYAVAQKHGGDKVLQKNTDIPVFYILDWNHTTSQLIWHVVYGASRDDAKLSVDVDASTGEYFRTEK